MYYNSRRVTSFVQKGVDPNESEKAQSRRLSWPRQSTSAKVDSQILVYKKSENYAL